MKAGFRAVCGIGTALTVWFPLLMSPSSGLAGDWPQILGPNRDGRALEERVADSFSTDGPKRLWELPVGDGLAGVAIVGESGILFHRRNDKEELLAFHPQTGEKLWATQFPASYSGSISPDNGPRCVPLIHKDRVFAFGAAGELHATGLSAGTKLWSRNLYKEFKGSEGYFGAGSCPIVMDDLLLLNVGGANGAGLVALRLADGEVAWKATDEGASYSSPVSVQLQGEPAAIFVTRLNCLAVRPSDGNVLWRFPFGARGPTVNAASPLIVDDHVFLSASYGVGAVWASLTSTGITKVWDNNETMSSQYTTCVLHGKYLYGVHGRADGGESSLRCFDPQTGRVLWYRDGFGVAHAILADNKLLMIKDDGTLVLVRPNPDRYEELASVQVLQKTVRALPALSGGRLYLRDTRRLICLDVSPQ